MSAPRRDQLSLCLCALVFVALSLLTGCGSDSPSSGSSFEWPSSPSQNDDQNQNNSISAFGRTVKVNCSDEKNCHPSAAVILARSSNGISKCMGSLISEDEFMTAGHCLPDYAQAGDSCQGSAAIFFPTIGKFQELKADCNKIVSIQNPKRGGNKVDYAILKLSKKVDRPKVELRKAGITEGENLTLFTALKNQNKSVSGVHDEYDFVPKTCKTIYRSFLNSAYIKPQSNIFTLGDCTIDYQHGDSGAAIFDEKGIVAGVAQAIFEKDSQVFSQAAELRSKVSSLQRRQLNFGTMAACIPDYADVSTLRACSSEQSWSDLLDLEARKQFQGVQAIERDSIFSWKYKLIPLNGEVIAALLPSCFQQREGWQKSYSSVLGGVQNVSTINSNQLVVADFEFSSYLQPVITRPARLFEGSIEFSPSSLETSGQSKVIVSLKTGRFSSQYVFAEIVYACIPSS